MAIKRASPYARAYTFGTDGSAALAGSPISSQRQSVTPPPPEHKQGIRFPRWAWIAVILAIFCTMMYIHASVNGQLKLVQNEVVRQRSEIIKTQDKISELEYQIEMASDETRIRSVAVNRLGMQRADESQIRLLPPLHLDQSTTIVAEEPPKENMNLFRLLLSTLGL